MKKRVVITAIILIILIPIIIYLVSPLFIDKQVNEPSPTQKLQNQNQTQDQIQETQTLQNPQYQGQFTGADSFHKVEGKALVLSQDNSKTLRLEDFKSTNGPDLKVYLSEDLNADSYISLGELKGNIGDQNYQIPENTDLEKYSNVLIWCEQFSVLFGHAELS